MNFFFRNQKYCAENSRNARNTVKVMREYKKVHPACEWCGETKRVHVHHKVSIWAAPELADDPENMQTLCIGCHFHIGHARNWKQYVKNPDELCKMVNIVKQKKE